ncbi:hypothetical protein EOA34_29930, partial [Mesorhizobium sp. M4B.F.Ca.ET.013.02.1.1]
MDRPFAAAAKLRVIPQRGINDLRSRQRFSVVTGPGYHAHGHAAFTIDSRQLPSLGESLWITSASDAQALLAIGRPMKDTKFSILPSSLPPRGLSRLEAAAYIGVSASLFDQLVKDGRMPKPKRINSR